MFKKMIIPGMIVLTLLCSVGLSGYSYISSDSLRSKIAVQEQQMAELNEELTEIEMHKVDVNEVKVAMNTASQAGNDVAALQNYYLTTELGTDDEDMADFSKRTQAVKALFGSSDQGAVVPWYSGEGCIWSFETTYSFSDNEVPVLWLCRDTSSERNVLAYATARYDADEGYFHDVKWDTVVRRATDSSSNQTIDRNSIWKALLGEAQDVYEASDDESTESEIIVDGDNEYGMTAHGYAYDPNESEVASE